MKTLFFEIYIWPVQYKYVSLIKQSWVKMDQQLLKHCLIGRYLYFKNSSDPLVLKTFGWNSLTNIDLIIMNCLGARKFSIRRRTCPSCFTIYTKEKLQVFIFLFYHLQYLFQLALYKCTYVCIGLWSGREERHWTIYYQSPKVL